MWVCPKCGSIKAGWADDICGDCRSHVIITDVTWDQFVEMDPVEEQKWRIEMTEKYVKSSPQFNERAMNQRLEDERAERLAEQNQPQCPICNSTKIHKISGTNKVGSALLFGIFSVGHVSKTFKCDNCGAEF